MVHRRQILSLLGAASIGVWFRPQEALAKRTKPIDAPIWLGVGVNASHSATKEGGLFPVLSLQAQKAGLRLEEPRSLTWLSQRISAAIREDNSVGIKILTGSQSLQRDQTTALSMVYDFEIVNALPTTMEDGVTYAIGYYTCCATGLVSILDGNGFWRILGSFPFYLKQQLDGGKMDRGRVEAWSTGAAAQVADRFHSGPSPSIKSIFVNKTKRFANWKDGYNEQFVRVMPVQFTPSVTQALQQFRIEKLFTAELVGVIASAELCSGLDVGVLPYTQTDALNRFQFQVADYGNLPQQPPTPDQVSMKVKVIVDFVGREVTPVQRQGFVHVRRGVRVTVDFLDIDGKTLASLRAGSVDADRLFSIEDSTPSRDFQFFASAMETAISKLFRGIYGPDKGPDRAVLASVGVNIDQVKPQLDVLLRVAGRLR